MRTIADKYLPTLKLLSLSSPPLLIQDGLIHRDKLYEYNSIYIVLNSFLKFLTSLDLQKPRGIYA